MRVGDGVVDVAPPRGVVTAREPARHIAAPDEIGQPATGYSAARRRIAGMDDGAGAWPFPASLAASSGAGSIPPPDHQRRVRVAVRAGAGRGAGPALQRSSARAAGRRFFVAGSAVPVQVRRGVVGQRCLFGDHMHHRRGRAPAAAASPRARSRHAAGRRRTQRTHRVGAALIAGARIGVAHRGGHRLQA